MSFKETAAALFLLFGIPMALAVQLQNCRPVSLPVQLPVVVVTKEVTPTPTATPTPRPTPTPGPIQPDEGVQKNLDLKRNMVEASR